MLCLGMPEAIFCYLTIYLIAFGCEPAFAFMVFFPFFLILRLKMMQKCAHKKSNSICMLKIHIWTSFQVRSSKKLVKIYNSDKMFFTKLIFWIEINVIVKYLTPCWAASWQGNLKIDRKNSFVGAGSERPKESAKMMFLHLRRNITGAPKTRAPKCVSAKKLNFTPIFYFYNLNF